MIRRMAGFTLIEALVAVAILAVVMSLGTPALIRMLALQRGNAAAQQLGHDLARARAAALMRRQPVVVCPLGAGNRCQPDRNWSHGWIVFMDRGHNHQPDADADVLWVHQGEGASGHGLSIGANRGLLRFRHDGTSPGTNLTFNICIDAWVVRQQILSNTGRARSVHAPERLWPCPA